MERLVTVPDVADVQAYYDARVDGKLRDFTHSNPRIEAAVQTIADWAPGRPARVLEIGCGIGATAWRMARAWPAAQVLGVDLSPVSIAVAQTCFRLPNLRFEVATAPQSTASFDLVVLMDVYEHIAMTARGALHATLRSLLGDDSRVILTIPTPALQQHARVTNPSLMQPVDEDVTPVDLLHLANETATRLLYYSEVDIWRYGDYFHVVLARGGQLGPVVERRGAISDWKRRRRFKVWTGERARLGARWERQQR